MTEYQKERIRFLRMGGGTYSSIAREVSLPEGTVKTYCNRNNINKSDVNLCPLCGKPVEQMPGRKLKRFCSDKCRLTWWNQNRAKLLRRNTTKIICPTCKVVFESYGTHRKYCCHACYIEDRFGKERVCLDSRSA